MGVNWIGRLHVSGLHEVVAWDTCWQPNRKLISLRPELRQDYPLNLSISISGGKETNKDCLVTASEPARAQLENLPLENCSL